MTISSSEAKNLKTKDTFFNLKVEENKVLSCFWISGLCAEIQPFCHFNDGLNSEAIQENEKLAISQPRGKIKALYYCKL